MTDVIKLAQEKRARKLGQIEELMGEVEELEEFIRFGTELTSEDGKPSEQSQGSSNDKGEDEAHIAAE